MKALFAIGLVVLILGVLSLFVPLPHAAQEGFKAGGVSIDFRTHHEERISPLVSGLLILAGAGLLIAGKGNS